MKRRLPVRPLVLTLAVLLTAGCESVFRDDADQAAYGLIQKRQRQTLGNTANSAISPGEIPVAITPEAYDKIPHTDNRLPVSAASAPTSAPAAATAPATAAATRPGSAMSPSASALLQARPDLKIESMPELPEFPRPPAGGGKYTVFTLDDCFNYALQHSRDYQTRKEDLFIAALNVTLERHQFEPRLFAQSSVNTTRAGEAGDYNAALTATQTIGVRQRLPYGGEVVAQALTTSVHQLHEYVTTGSSADLILSANIPLLRGAGMSAQESLIQAERNLIYAVRDFERYRRAFLVQVASQYFNLVNQRAQIVNRYRNVNSYIFITRRSQALFEAGRRTTLLDVQRAAQAEFTARNDLINAIESYEQSLDNFKLLLGMPTDQPLDVAVQYLNIAPPSITETQALEIAFKLRLDLQTDRDQVDDARRGIKVAANNLLPDLNLTGQADMASEGKWSVRPNPDNVNLSAGVTLDLPLDRVAERNAYRISQISLARAKRNVETMQDQVVVDVRAAMRRVRQQVYLLAIQKNNIELAQKRKQFADFMFQQGRIDNRDYLDAETALLDAQNRFAQALSGLETATLQYLRDTDQLRVDTDGRLLLPPGATGISVTTRPAENAPASQPGPAAEAATQPAIPQP